MRRRPTRRRRRGRGNRGGRMCGGRGASAEEGRRGQGVSAAIAAGMMASREGSRERTGGRHDGARGHDTRRAAMGRAPASGRGDGTERRADTAHRSTREGPEAGTGTGRRGSRPCGGAGDPPRGKHPRFRTRPRRPGTGTDTGGLPRADGGTGSTTRRDGTPEHAGGTPGPRAGGRGARHGGTAHRSTREGPGTPCPRRHCRGTPTPCPLCPSSAERQAPAHALPAASVPPAASAPPRWPPPHKLRLLVRHPERRLPISRAFSSTTQSAAVLLNFLKKSDNP